MNPFFKPFAWLPASILLGSIGTPVHAERLLLAKGRTITPYETSADLLEAPLSITGIDWIETIDVRPSDGQLFALGVRIEDGLPGVFSIDLGNQKATPVGEPFKELRGAAVWSLAFNPVSDHLRIISSSGANLVFDTIEGKVLKSSAALDVVGIGYGAGPNPLLYGLKGRLLVVVNEADGSLSTIGDTGHTPLASLGFGFGVSRATGKAYGYFDTPFGTIDGELYEIDLTTAKSRLLRTSAIWIPSLAVASVPEAPVSGVYRITGGGFRLCCGLLGPIEYLLPDEEQHFIVLTVTPGGGPASMSILGQDEETVFKLPGGNLRPDFAYRFTGGIVSANSITFRTSDPGPAALLPSYSYELKYTSNQLSLHGHAIVPCQFCADFPEEFNHVNVVATLAYAAPQIEDVRRDGDRIKFTFQGEAGYNYFVDFAESIPAVEWNNLATFRTKLVGIRPEVTDTVGGKNPRFYRIRKEPCLCR